MSVEGIRAIIRLHSGPHPKETGPIPHSEVVEMIDSAWDHGRVTPKERAELLAAIAMFGDTVPGRASLLSKDDEEAIKRTVLSGIETLADFLKWTIRDQANFLIYCVLLGSAEYVGFQQGYVDTESIDPGLAAFIDHVLQENLRHAGSGFNSTTGFQPTAVNRNGEVYGYLLNASFPAKDGSGSYDVTDVIGANNGFFRLVFGQFDPPGD